jgi:hypothetical protein
LEFRSGLELQPILRKAWSNELLLDGGTRVSVRLKTDPFSKGGILAKEGWGNRIEKVELKLLIGSLCPSTDANVSVEVKGRDRRCLRASDWQTLDGLKLLRRIAGSPFSKGIQTEWDAYAAHLRALVDEKGKMHGRACIVGVEDSYFKETPGVCTVGGFRATGLSKIAGVLFGNTDTVRRDQAIPTVPGKTLLEWASEQAKLISGAALPQRQKLKAAAIILQCRGSIGPLPIATRNGQYLSYDELQCVLKSEQEVIVYGDERVSYDEDKDACHPKEFEGSFETEERIFYVWNLNSAVLTIGDKKWPQDFLEVSNPPFPSTLTEQFERAIIATWGTDYETCDEERPVGQVNGDDILRDVTVYRRPKLG